MIKQSRTIHSSIKARQSKAKRSKSSNAKEKHRYAHFPYYKSCPSFSEPRHCHSLLLGFLPCRITLFLSYRRQQSETQEPGKLKQSQSQCRQIADTIGSRTRMERTESKSKCNQYLAISTAAASRMSYLVTPLLFSSLHNPVSSTVQILKDPDQNRL